MSASREYEVGFFGRGFWVRAENPSEAEQEFVVRAKRGDYGDDVSVAALNGHRGTWSGRERGWSR